MKHQISTNEFKQNVKADFNTRPNYDQGSFHPRLAKGLVELSHLQTGQRILDIATGTGLVAIRAAKIVGASGAVVGVDISSGMLNLAQRKVKAEGLNNIKFIEADAETINFPDNSFDRILCSSAIVYLTDIPAALRQWYRFVKPGGLVGFSCFAAKAFPTGGLFREKAGDYGIVIPNPNQPLGSPEKCHQLLTEAGFQDINLKTDQLGYYSSDTQTVAANSWRGNSKSAFGAEVFQLSPEKLAQLKTEFFAAVEQLATAQGIWIDITTFFVCARKSITFQIIK
ncbi:MAG: class I SAM-dependent methyltransferase [Moorea sp. SIO4A3]|nr:class I SAM-dependent methyltransferase [Moorena sp. SIO4A3]